MAALTAFEVANMVRKDLSMPMGIQGKTADEVMMALAAHKIEVRVIPATDAAAIIRASNSYVTILQGVDELTTVQRDDLFNLTQRTRWRKALIIPHTVRQEVRLYNRMVNVELV